MATSTPAFYSLWQEERIRERLFRYLSKEDICSVRLANSACCNLVTKRLFVRTNLSFTSNTFTRQSRVQALSRIGHHIEHLTFSFPHSESTFLPPLVHPESGKEISFLYTPHTSMASVLSRPKYGNSELGDILTQQYPPLFHAATNVPSFINAMKHIPNMRHLTIKTPGQNPTERYRRDIVDYALISLRISLERATLDKLSKLSLSGVHPSAFNYLRHVPGFGCRPSAGRRWKQIRKLYISVDSWDFYGPSPGLDHLKIIDDYIRQFAPKLDKFSFTWLGRRGPCPLTLAGDPLFAAPRSSQKLFNEITSPMSPLPQTPIRESIKFPRLRHLTVRNATMNAPQIKDLVGSHQGSVREFNFENVALLNGGNWDDALAPLTDAHSDRGSDVWSRHSLGGSGSEAGSYRPTTSSSREEELPSPSAAVAAASQSLLELDVEGLENYFGFHGCDTLAPPQELDEDDGGLASDIAAAREASLSFSTKLKKKRIRRKHRRHHREEAEDSETERPRRTRKQSHHSERSERSERSEKSQHSHLSRSRSESRSSHRHRRHKKSSSDPTPELPTHHHPFAHLTPPQVHTEVSLPSRSLLDLDEEGLRTPTPAPLNISAPILARSPVPAMLQPTTYDPSAAQPRPSTDADDGLSAVQRNLEQEESQRRMAEDAEARYSALKKAKAAVLSKLGREFQRRMAGREQQPPRMATGCGGEQGRRRLFGESLVSVVPEHRSIGGDSALVPLMFSRG
jgi:hypothetical protein